MSTIIKVLLKVSNSIIHIILAIIRIQKLHQRENQFMQRLLKEPVAFLEPSPCAVSVCKKIGPRRRSIREGQAAAQGKEKGKK